MSALANYFDIIYGSPRFDFLLQSDSIKKYTKSLSVATGGRGREIASHAPLLAMIGNDFNIYWEYRDGVLDVSPVESAVVLYQVLERFGNKPFFYVKPSFSTLKCRNIVRLAQENNGIVLGCPKWSYMEFYSKFYPQRHEIRKAASFKNKKLDTVFLGRMRADRPCPRVAADWTDERYKYPVYKSQVDFLKYPPPLVGVESVTPVTGTKYDESRKQTEIPGYPQRPWFVERLREEIPVTHIEGKTTDEALDIYLDSKIQFQPHGVGPRHAIYESMMLGIPSIIPECSYLDGIVREHNFICSELMHYIPVDDINAALSDEKTYQEISEGIVEIYEKYMTNDAIVSGVLNAIERSILLNGGKSREPVEQKIAD